MNNQTKESDECSECKGSGKVFKRIFRGYPMPPMSPHAHYNAVDPYKTIKVDCQNCNGTGKSKCQK